MVKPRRPKDTNQRAKLIMELATGGEIEKELSPKAVSGRKGGLKGGKARAKKLTPEQRSEIARKAAEKRWGNNGK